MLPTGRLLNCIEVAEFLGFTPLTVRRMAHAGKLPAIAFHAGPRKTYYRFRAEAIEDYLAKIEQTGEEK